MSDTLWILGLGESELDPTYYDMDLSQVCSDSIPKDWGTEKFLSKTPLEYPPQSPKSGVCPVQPDSEESAIMVESEDANTAPCAYQDILESTLWGNKPEEPECLHEQVACTLSPALHLLGGGKKKRRSTLCTHRKKSKHSPKDTHSVREHTSPIAKLPTKLDHVSENKEKVAPKIADATPRALLQLEHGGVQIENSTTTVLTPEKLGVFYIKLKPAVAILKGFFREDTSSVPGVSKTFGKNSMGVKSCYKMNYDLDVCVLTPVSIPATNRSRGSRTGTKNYNPLELMNLIAFHWSKHFNALPIIKHKVPPSTNLTDEQHRAVHVFVASNSVNGVTTWGERTLSKLTVMDWMRNQHRVTPQVSLDYWQHVYGASQ